MYAVILVGDICTVLPISILNKYDVIVFKGSREQCFSYQDNHNRAYLRDILINSGFHKSYTLIKPSRS